MVALRDDADPAWPLLLAGWRQSMAAAGRSPRTIKIYIEAATYLANWVTGLPDPPEGYSAPGAAAGRRRARAAAAEAGEAEVPLYRPAEPAQITRGHVERFLIDRATTPTARRPDGLSDSYVNQTFRALQQWFAWLVAEGEADDSPTRGMPPPTVAPKLVDVVSLDTMGALLATCSGRAFVDRRDNAILRVFGDTGARLAEVAGLAVADVELDHGRVHVVGKGRRPRYISVGTKTALALNRYARARAAHPHAAEAALWLGRPDKGGAPMTPSGVYQMFKRRAREAGLDIHPHQLRHTLAHEWLAAGGGEQALADHMGWTSTQMAARYGAILRAERADAEHKKLNLGQRY